MDNKLSSLLAGAGAVTATAVCSISLLLLTGCNNEETNGHAEQPTVAAPLDQQIAQNPNKNAYYGDLHVHTRYSFDAFIFGTRTDPNDAYRFARGEAISHPAGFTMQLKKPLDFQAVTDHAMYLGMLPAMFDATTSVSQHPISKKLAAAATADERRIAFNSMFPYLRGQVENDDLLDMSVVRSAWQSIIEAAEANNDPGEFTTFIAYEYTAAGSARENLHRNVIFRDEQAPALPFSSMESSNPEKLWTWMDEQRADGIEALAIPHNSNGSDGMMFQLTNWDGDPIDAAYAELRMRNEPLVEISQVKGTSETHPLLSPNDEWADFELMNLRIATDLHSKAAGSYVREAYRNGLLMEETQGVNPYRFGIVAASDTHVSAGSFDESNYWSKVGILDATGELRGSVPLQEKQSDGSYYDPANYFQTWGASGLAAVWAEANTREAIYDAFRRKETFGTSGPRIQVRFFAGYNYDDDTISAGDVIEQGYAGGVAMGGDLDRKQDSPTFLAWALRDADSAPLQRLQIVKGWVENDNSNEQVFDVACSSGEVDPQTHRCADNGASVDISDCSTDVGTGVAELKTQWQDPDYDPTQRAFYYVRVLENPTCRWSTWDAVRAGTPPRPGLATTIQERAWTSPIWLR